MLMARQALTYKLSASDLSKLKVLFHELADTWREETSLTSSVVQMSIHPAYQRIIGLGQAAVPLILQELQKAPDHWFWALSAITGENPIPPEHEGDLEKMTADWIQLGMERGWLPRDHE